MKLHYCFVPLIALLLLAGACTFGEVESPQDGLSDGLELEFTGSFDPVETKSTAIPDGNNKINIHWSRGDAVRISFGSSLTGSRFVATNDEDFFPRAHFSGTLEAFTGLNESGEVNYFWAIYPFEQAVACDGEIIVARLPHEQVAKAGTFADNTNISIAKSLGLSLSFYNTCSWFRFSVAKENIRSVTFQGNDGEYVAGIFNDTFGSDGKPVPPTVMNGEQVITLSAPPGEFFQKDQYYYFTLFPQTFRHGVTITFYADDGIGTFSTSGSVEFKRSSFKTEKHLDSKASFANNTVLSYTSEYPLLDYMNLDAFDASILSHVCEDDVWHITFHGALTEIGDEAFSGCSGLTSITIPETVRTIGTNAFSETGLTSVNIPASVENIDFGAFSNCLKLETITVDADNPYFDSRNNCNAIIQTDDNLLVAGCKGTTIPSSVEEIGRMAFYGSGLQTVTIPASVSVIGSEAFSDCGRLFEVTFESPTPPDGGEDVFANHRKNDFVIFVPPASISSYKTTDPWSEYEDFIYGIGTEL